MLAVLVPANNEESLAGTTDLAWQRWLNEVPLHELPIQHLLRASARLVIVAPHPDDEILASGGLISTHAAQGGRVLIVAVTDGEASSFSATPSSGHADLAAIRRSERWLGLQRLGLQKPTVLALALKDGLNTLQVNTARGASIQQNQVSRLCRGFHIVDGEFRTVLPIVSPHNFNATRAGLFHHARTERDLPLLSRRSRIGNRPHDSGTVRNSGHR